MKSMMQVSLNLDEALFIKSAMIHTLEQENKESIGVFWPNADFENILRQLDVIIDVLFLEED